MSTENTEPEQLPDMIDFCLNVPLYKTFYFDKDYKLHQEKLREIFYFADGHLDCFCRECNKESVFHPEHKSDDQHFIVRYRNSEFQHVFTCTRNKNHKLFFLFLFHDWSITKIGQHPSLADLASVEIQKYRKVLGNESYAEFNRAVGLVTHGVGIGAFVYLRRIFENLIEEAHQGEMTTSGWDDGLYKKAHIEERITLLKNSLPNFLVENRSLYSILSKGIHELTESECLGAFPITKLGIELILDEKLEKLERDKKIKEASKGIGDLAKKLKS
ncbi:MAG: short-chain dehydrogenase [Chloroflexi bacterium]|nr:short-chain dehydrogenase [Chloroflexota bacterium]